MVQLQMIVRALRACNTTTGLHSYSIVVMGQPSELPMIQSSMEACNLQFEVAFAHCSGSEGKYISNIIHVVLLKSPYF